MRNSYLLIVIISFFIMLTTQACNKNKDQLNYAKNNNNLSTYPNAKIDSVQAIQLITKQKVNEILDLAILYKTGRQDTELDSVLYKQMMNYFYKPDSKTLKKLFSEIDSFQVKSVNIKHFDITKRIYNKDTLNFAQFSVEYFNDQNQSIAQLEREAQYVLVPAEIQFKKEFKFFFLNFYGKPLNDSILKKIN